MSELGAAYGRLLWGRKLHGIAATLLPFNDRGRVDWRGFERHVARTHDAGLGVAVNMDTGFGDLLSPGERAAVLRATRSALGPGVPFHAAALADPGDVDPVPSYHDAIAEITALDATPVITQSRAMHGLEAVDLAALYARIVEPCEAALAFELSPAFAPHGGIWSGETFRRIMDLPTIVGVKHSSLDRRTELARLAARDEQRPGFRVYTGNDLAIDMVAYGSDYLLGLATFAPEAFAARDRAFGAGSLDFLGWNDSLQHLGNVAFRAPIPAYKHSAAIYLHLTGGLDGTGVHPRAARRPDAAVERAVLGDCADRLARLRAAEASGDGDQADEEVPTEATGETRDR